jgi:hypothetical protein
MSGIAKLGSNGSGMEYDHRSRQNTAKEAITGNKKKKLRASLSPALLNRSLGPLVSSAFN